MYAMFVAVSIKKILTKLLVHIAYFMRLGSFKINNA